VHLVGFLFIVVIADARNHELEKCFSLNIQVSLHAPGLTGHVAHLVSRIMLTESLYRRLNGRGVCVDHPPPTSAEIKEREELHL
jgi:hypothetical protein